VSSSGGTPTTILRGVSSGVRKDRFWYSEPAWSRDGGCVAAVVSGYPTGTHEYADIEVKRGSRRIQWGGVSVINRGPSWGPNGHSLVFVGYDWSDGGSLYIDEVGTSNGTDLTPDGGKLVANFPAWSPDGSWIAFTRVSPRQRLFLIRPDGTGLRRVTNTVARNPSWSPDGKKIVFDDGRRIAVVNADGSDLAYLTGSRDIDVDPAWSPDGRTIAFVRYKSAKANHGDIWLMSAAGADQRLFVRNGRDPAWRPR
jgi:Tol biopolymer transport system component